MLIVGEKEEKDRTVSVRRRHLGNIGTFSIDDLIDDLNNEILSRRRV